MASSSWHRQSAQRESEREQSKTRQTSHSGPCSTPSRSALPPHTLTQPWDHATSITHWPRNPTHHIPPHTIHHAYPPFSWPTSHCLSWPTSHCLSFHLSPRPHHNASHSLFLVNITINLGIRPHFRSEIYLNHKPSNPGTWPAAVPVATGPPLPPLESSAATPGRTCVCVCV